MGGGERRLDGGVDERRRQCGVDVDARLGIKVDWLLPAVIGLLIAGVVVLAGGAVLVIFGGRGLARRRRQWRQQLRRSGRLRRPR